MSCVGIAVVTYKRPEHLKRSLIQLLALTKGEYELVVFIDDDNDTDSIKICEEFCVSYLAAKNSGVIRNKNRALYYFMEKTNSDPIILLEDDCFPIVENWQSYWVKTTKKWQHVNYSHPSLFIQHKPSSGSGIPEDPHIHKLVTGQCTSISREAIATAGYLDPRFQGFGHGHVEWSRRYSHMIHHDGLEKNEFVSILGGLYRADAPTFKNEKEVNQNEKIMSEIYNQQPTYQLPYINQKEKNSLEHEVDNVKIIHRKSFEEISQKYDIKYVVLENENDQLSTEQCALIPNSVISGKKGIGYIDSLINIDGNHCFLIGWAIDNRGQKVCNFDVQINGLPTYIVSVESYPRIDVGKIFAGADIYSGVKILIKNEKLIRKENIKCFCKEPFFELELAEAFSIESK